VIERTYRFPGGSLIMYSYNDFSEIVLYNNKKVVYKVYGDTFKIGTLWDELIQMIEQDFTEIIVKRLQEINTEKGV
jgi:hypothetical protein